MGHWTGNGLIDLLLTVVLIIVVAIVIVKVCQALGITANNISIPGLEGLLP